MLEELVGWIGRRVNFDWGVGKELMKEFNIERNKGMDGGMKECVNEWIDECFGDWMSDMCINNWFVDFWLVDLLIFWYIYLLIYIFFIELKLIKEFVL